MEHQERPDRRDGEPADDGDLDGRRGQRVERLADAGRHPRGEQCSLFHPAQLVVHRALGGRADRGGVVEDDEGVFGPRHLRRQPAFGDHHPQRLRARQRRRQFGDRAVERDQHVVQIAQPFLDAHGPPNGAEPREYAAERLVGPEKSGRKGSRCRPGWAAPADAPEKGSLSVCHAANPTPGEANPQAASAKLYNTVPVQRYAGA
ncbi:hypothetical protein ALI144C_03465 [Actinosynnema sp. ALI-1.44]|nr:hypothetical protein ALI144C_03465 [Actinosynnema sp. ALI-1.44]